MQSTQSITVSKKTTNMTASAIEQPVTTFPEPRDWQAITRAWESSGIPQKKFCEIHTLSYITFVYQRTKLKKGKNKTKPLLPVQVIQPQQPASSVPAAHCCVVQWPNGVKLSVSSGIDDVTLDKLLISLGSL